MLIIPTPGIGPVASQRQSERGVSLIEVLVSIVIASIALLALAGVNASSIRYTKMSQYRATAALLATDMGERMRANKGQAATLVPVAAATGYLGGAYDYLETFADQATEATLPAELCNLSTSICTPAQIAALDLAQWRLLVRKQLPEGSVVITRQVAEVSAEIWVVWRDPAVASTDEAPAAASECPGALTLASDLSVRCSFFRVSL